MLIRFTFAERDNEIGPSWSQSSRTSGGDKKSEGKVAQQKMHLHNANAQIDFLCDMQIMQAQFRNEENTRTSLLNVTSAMGEVDKRIQHLESKVILHIF